MDFTDFFHMGSTSSWLTYVQFKILPSSLAGRLYCVFCNDRFSLSKQIPLYAEETLEHSSAAIKVREQYGGKCNDAHAKSRKCVQICHEMFGGKKVLLVTGMVKTAGSNWCSESAGETGGQPIKDNWNGVVLGSDPAFLCADKGTHTYTRILLATHIHIHEGTL